VKRLAVIAVVAAALAAPSSAFAGGMGVWALSGPERGMKAGDVWLAQVRVVGCQGIPMDAVPTVAITSESGQRLTFRGRTTGVPGKYTARVVFPSAGKWSYQIELWGTAQDRHGPFVVGPAQKPDRLIAAVPPLGAVLLVLGTGLILRRRRP
jgi:hypothetical protein